MYYYIMEPPRRKFSVWQEKVKNVLGELGIAGEIVIPSTARTIEELANLGITKGYSTIVGIGSESIANEIATAIINHKDGENAVLGFVPEDFESPLAQKIGVTNLLEACQTLKFRKLERADAVFFQSDKYFLTEALIESNHQKAYAQFNNVEIYFPFDIISIRPGLEMRIIDTSGGPQDVKKFFNWLVGKEENDISSSFFHADQVRIISENRPLSITAGGKEISKTPIICQNKPKALKIIVARDTIFPKE